jgi:hypothetical protein
MITLERWIAPYLFTTQDKVSDHVTRRPYPARIPFTWFQSRLSMQMELMALRHQVAVYKQSVSRPKLRPTDRLLWVWLSRLWPSWQQALEFVQPRTVII